MRIEKDALAKRTVEASQVVKIAVKKYQHEQKNATDYMSKMSLA